MDEQKIELKAQIIYVIFCAVVFSTVYNASAWYTSTLSNVSSFVFNIESHIPFLPITIIPYLTSGVFFVSVFFCCNTLGDLKVLSKRILFITVIAGLSYLVYPLKFSLERPEVNNSVLNFLFQFITKVDSPFNEAPSLHIAFAFVFWTVYKERKSTWKKGIGIWLFLLGVSTLTTYQHHLLDILTGAILAHISFIIFPKYGNKYELRNFHISNYYYSTGWILCLTSLLLSEFYSLYWLVLTWFVVVIFLIGLHYEKNNVHFLKDQQGIIKWYKKVFYFPYLAIYWFFWKFLRTVKKPIAVLPKMYISSRLGKKEIQYFKFDANTFVYDFSAELEEHKWIKDQSPYIAFPLLDIGGISTSKIRNIIIEISEKYHTLTNDGRIVIHCTMGLSRSTFIAILVVQNILSLSISESVIKVTHRHKKAVIRNYTQYFLKTFDI